LVLGGQLRGAIAIMSDSGFPEELRDSLAMLSSQITLALESQTLREHLRRSEERFRSLVQHSSDIVTIVDAGTAIQYQTPSIERICGYGPTELLGQPFPALIHEDDLPQARAFFAELGAHPRASATIEWRYRHRDGVWLQLDTTGTNLLDDAAVQGIVLNSRDISVHKQLEARLTEQALRDALTGLANHRALLAALDQEVERSQRFQHPCAVLFLDLDHFKALNDGYGHQAGDAALRAFGEAAAAALRATDTLGRWGGEEFVALLPETEAAAALTTAERVRAAVADLTLEACAGAQITCSIGVAVYPADARDVDGLVTAADRAMYAAKGLGRNQVRSAADPAVAALDGVTVANGSRQDATLRGTVDDHVAQRNIGRARRSLDSRTRGRRADRDRARPYSDPRIAASACGKRARAQPETGGAA
jgi:diguanylate cyclase (GGDEF)-like protein/PAS domain S-box-containing protein